MYKNIIIKSLKLHEFLGATGEMDIKLNRNLTEIIGDNGKGKSLILNAVAFLLTGKDAFGQNRVFFSNSGNKIGFTFVEANLSLDGEDVVLKRLIQRNSTGKCSTDIWIDHNSIKLADWKSMVDEDICLSLINPKYLSSLKPSDMKKVVLKMLNLKDIDFKSLWEEVIEEATNALASGSSEAEDEFDEMMEVVDIYNSEGEKDIDKTYEHVASNLKVVKANIKEKKDFKKAFEAKPVIAQAPFYYKIGEKYYADKTDAYNAVEEAIKNDPSEENMGLLRTLLTVVEKYALQNKDYLDYCEEERRYKENELILKDRLEEENLLNRQISYLERVNEKIIEKLNLAELKKLGLSFEFTDLFDKKTFSICYNGNLLEDCSYAEQVNAAIKLCDYLMGYLDMNYPMFIDNAECITTLPKVDANRQLISMQVAYGYELSYYEDTCIREVKTLKTMPKVDKTDLVRTRILGDAFELAE